MIKTKSLCFHDWIKLNHHAQMNSMEAGDGHGFFLFFMHCYLDLLSRNLDITKIVCSWYWITIANFEFPRQNYVVLLLTSVAFVRSVHRWNQRVLTRDLQRVGISWHHPHFPSSTLFFQPQSDEVSRRRGRSDHWSCRVAALLRFTFKQRRITVTRIN